VDVVASIRPGSPDSVILQDSSGKQISLQNLEVVWWRKPQLFPQHGNWETPVHEFVQEQQIQFWAGLLAALPERIRWYNHFQKELQASRKIYQLEIALECGFLVPKTLITSNPMEARIFLQEHASVVCKELATTGSFWRPTQPVTKELQARFDSLSVCPVIFQEFISGEEDYRVIVIDDFIEAVAFDMKNSRYPFDVSMDLLNRCRRTEIPEGLKTKLQAYMKRLGLRYGAFDFRKNDQGEFVFFEVNPSGEFLFLDQQAETNISAQMARALSTNDKGRQLASDTSAQEFPQGLPFLLQTPERKPVL
jgi:glutathione synthase/RimK-type ligase-like ATP-grasp enzyme